MTTNLPPDTLPCYDQVVLWRHSVDSSFRPEPASAHSTASPVHSQPTPGVTAEFLSALITTIIIISLWPSGSLLVRVFKIIIIHHTAVAITEPRVEQFSWYSDCWYYIRYNQQDWAKLRQSLHIQLNRIPTATNIHSCSNFTYECLSILFCIIYLHIMDGRRKAKKHKNSPD